MAVNKPKKPQFPRARKGRQPGPGQLPLPGIDVAGPIPGTRAVKRTKTIEQTQTPRTKGAGEEGGFSSIPPPIRAVRNRGSAFGRYTPDQDTDDIVFPQIDPTNTTNPNRPRTMQAGYYRDRGAATGTLRVRFRDGTPWEYYDVPPNVWRNFKRVRSPGRFINRVLNQYDYGRGDF